MEEITAAYVRRLLPRRDPMGHKGTFGKVLCVCGSVGFSGAAVFAGRAAAVSYTHLTWCFSHRARARGWALLCPAYRQGTPSRHALTRIVTVSAPFRPGRHRPASPPCLLYTSPAGR